MNSTHLEHSVYAVIIQLLLFYFVGWYVAGALGVMFLVGREYAQAEYKARKITGLTLTQLQPWHLIDKRFWSMDAFLDVAAPIAVVYSVALFATTI